MSGSSKGIFVLFYIIMILLGALIVYLVPDDGWPIWAFFGLMLSISMVLEAVGNKSFDIFSPLFILTIAFALVFWVGAIRYIDSQLDNISLYIYYACLSYGFFCLGFVSSKPSLKNKPDINISSLNRKILVIITLFVSFLATIYMIKKVGIPAFYGDKLNARLEAREIVTSYVIYLIRVSQFSVYFALSYALISLHNSSSKIYFNKNLMSSAFILILSLVINFLPGWRGPVFLVLFSCLLLWHYLYRRISFLGFLISMTSGFLVAFGWGFWRIASSAKGVGSLAYLDSDGNIGLVFVEWVSYQFSAYFLGFITVIDNFSKGNYLGFGGVYLLTLKTILPGKQDTFGEVLKDTADLAFDGGGLNPTLLGESYADFGIVSLIAYMLIFGWLLGKLYKSMIVNSRVSELILYAYLLPVCTLSVFTGLLSQASYSFHLVVLLSMFLFMKLKVHPFRH